MTYRLARFTVAAVALAVSGVAHDVPLTARQQRATPTGLDVRKFDAIEALVRDEIGQKRLPGAVVLIGVGDRIVYQKAIGNRALVPSAEPMTLDTIFDVASLTKVVATTTSVMMLIEQGKLRLVDRVATFIPGFERYGKADITIRHLLTHVSGLRPDVDLADEWAGTDAAIQLAVEEVPTAPPGTRFVYSDINFFLLGEIVRRVSGKPLDQYAQEHVFKPLGMKDTMFNPPASLIARIAPTESCTPYGWPCDGPDRKMLRGVVHDPTARRMSGVAGHAGLFSTAADLAIFSRMLLNNGAYPGRADSRAADGGEDDDAGAERGPQRPRARLGRRFQLLGQPRRAAAHRVLRPHRLHGHVALDRSGDADVRRVPVQPRPSRWQGRRHAAPGAGCHDRRFGDRRRAGESSHGNAHRAGFRRRAAGRCQAA